MARPEKRDQPTGAHHTECDALISTQPGGIKVTTSFPDESSQRRGDDESAREGGEEVTQRLIPSDLDRDAAGHVHRDCGAGERLWLPRDCHDAATAALHPYCRDCGTVKNLSLPRGRPLGYFCDAIANLKEYLEHSLEYEKLAQVQSHLMSTRLASRREFEDPWGTPGRAQLEAYVAAVKRVRPELDEELVLRMLPDRRRRRRSSGSVNEGAIRSATHPRN